MCRMRPDRLLAGAAVIAILWIALGLGCATRDDANYNPYASPRGEPTVLERGDALMDAAADLLDDLDERLENAVY